MSDECFTQADLDAAERAAREHDARVRADRGEVVLIDFGCLVGDMIRFMPEGLSEEREAGYVEAVRDLFVQIAASTLEQSATDGSLAHAPNQVSVPLSVVDRALERRAEGGRGA